MGCRKSIFRSTRICYKRTESLYWRLETFYYEGKLLKNLYSLLGENGRLFIYDIPFEKIQSVDDEAIHFVKRYVYTLIGKPDHIYGTLTDHEYSFIHDDLFDRILATDQNPDILLKLIHKDVTLTSINDNSAYSKPKFRSMSEFFHFVINSRVKYRKSELLLI